MTLPNCRLFLVTPRIGDIDQLTDCLNMALAAGDVASLLISEPDTAGFRQLAQQLLPLAQSGDAAVLIENNSDLVAELGADGIEVPADLTVYRTAREHLGPNLAIGANCRADRHVAMEMAEAGADYVRISPFADGPGDEPLVAWWSELFEIPSVTSDPLGTADLARAARLGADFVRPDDTMWASPQAAADIIGAAMEAMAQ